MKKATSAMGFDVDDGGDIVQPTEPDREFMFGAQVSLTAEEIRRAIHPDELARMVKRKLFEQLAHHISEHFYGSVERRYDDQRFLGETFRLELVVMSKDEFTEMCQRVRSLRAKLDHATRLQLHPLQEK